MSILINGMEMPKQIKEDERVLWNIRNETVGQDEQFGAAQIPCDLIFNHDGTIHLSVLGRRYTLTNVPTPHGDLIDRDELASKLIPVKDAQSGIAQTFMEWLIALIKEKPPTIIEAEE